MTGTIRLHYTAICLSAVAVLFAVRDLPVDAFAQDTSSPYAAIVAAADRTDADRQADQRRDPLKLLAFAAPQLGIKVLDMGAGGGYSTELMARAVAP